MNRPLSDEERELRAYPCGNCGARPGQSCRTTRGRRLGSLCLSHGSRREQRSRQLLGVTYRETFIPDPAVTSQSPFITALGFWDWPSPAAELLTGRKENAEKETETG